MVNLRQHGRVGRVQQVVLSAVLVVGIALSVLSLMRGRELGRDADVLRVWEMSQYAWQHKNPYAPTLRLLRERFGESKGANLKDNRIWSVKNSTTWDASTPGILPEYGPVDATYPPGAMLLFMVTFGMIPEGLVYPVWSVAILASLLVVARLLAPTLSGRPGDHLFSTLGCLGIFLIWPPTQHSLLVGQFSLPVLAALLGAVALGERRPLTSGAVFSLALIKPSLSLPIILYPVFMGWWRSVVVVALSQIALLLVSGLWFGESPIVLVSEWLSIGSYFLQGAYTLQEVLNRLGWENSLKGALLSLSTVGVLSLVAFVRARLHPHLVVGLLSYAAILWMYHERYDFVLLLIPLVTILHGILVSSKPKLSVCLPLGLLITLGLALSETVYTSDSPIAGLMRWAGRFSLLLLVCYQVWEMVKRRDGEVMYTTAPI